MPETASKYSAVNRVPRQMRSLKEASECGGELGVAGFAPMVGLATANHRRANVATPGANGTVRPTHLFEAPPARIMSRKLFEKARIAMPKRMKGYHEC